MKRADKVDFMERGTVAQVLIYANTRHADRPEFLAAYLNELHRLCISQDFDFSILAAQSANETDSWTSAVWIEYGNPAGIGVTNSQNLSLIYKTGTDAARAHVVHFYVYSRGRIPIGNELLGYIPLDPRYEPALKAFGNTIDTINDFNVNGRWALLPLPPWYGDRIVNSGNAIFGDLEQQPSNGGTPPMPDVQLAIRKSLIPAGNKNRPGVQLNSGGLWLTTHDTGNSGAGANAEMHRRFTHNPATTVSFHFTVDDKEAIQLLPLNEIGYHAADGCNNRATDIGCYASAATELCINSDGNWWQAYANLKDLYAAIITGDSRIDFGGRKGDFHESRLTTHQKVSDTNKYCPASVLNKGLVADLQAGVVARVKLIEGQPTDPGEEPVYAKPYPVEKGTRLVNDHLFLAPGGKTVMRPQAPMQYADAEAQPTGAVFPVDHKFEADDFTHYVFGTDNQIWVILKDGSRFPGMAFVEEEEKGVS